MKTQLYLGIALRIIIFFLVVMLMTFIPDHLRGFFGDTELANGYQSGIVDRHWDWGVRHYWYGLMCLCLFILSAVNVMMSIEDIINRQDK